MNSLLIAKVEEPTLKEKSKNSLNELLLAQTSAHSSRTDKYSVVTSGDIVAQFLEAGFTGKVVAMEKSTRKYFGFGTHLICLENPSLTLGNAELDKELRPQLYIKNSYHGRTRFELHYGLFRTFCLNGLILGNKFKVKKAKHIWLTKDDVNQMVKDMQEVMTKEVVPYILKLKERKLTDAEQIEFAKAALAERLRDNPNFIQGEAQLLLTVNRPEDAGNSAWEVLQRVQENLGLNFGSEPIELSYEYKAKDKDDNDVIKERNISVLKNIQKVTYLNQFLFDRVSDYLVE